MDSDQSLREEIFELVNLIFAAIDAGDESLLSAHLSSWTSPRIAAFVAQAGSSLDLHDQGGNSFATFAATHDAKMLGILAHYEIDLSEPDENGWKPATAAASAGYLDAIKELEKLDCPLFEPDANRETPLSLAREGYYEHLRRYETAHDAYAKALAPDPVRGETDPERLAELKKNADHQMMLMGEYSDTANFLEEYEERDTTLALKQDVIDEVMKPPSL